jgi:hypothetical protein
VCHGLITSYLFWGVGLNLITKLHPLISLNSLQYRPTHFHCVSIKTDLLSDSSFINRAKWKRVAFQEEWRHVHISWHQLTYRIEKVLRKALWEECGCLSCTESGEQTLASWILDRRPSSSEIEKKCFIANPATYPISNWPHHYLHMLLLSVLRPAKCWLFRKVTTTAQINRRGDTFSSKIFYCPLLIIYKVNRINDSFLLLIPSSLNAASRNFLPSVSIVTSPPHFLHIYIFAFEKLSLHSLRKRRHYLDAFFSDLSWP